MYSNKPCSYALLQWRSWGKLAQCRGPKRWIAAISKHALRGHCVCDRGRSTERWPTNETRKPQQTEAIKIPNLLPSRELAAGGPENSDLLIGFAAIQTRWRRRWASQTPFLLRLLCGCAIQSVPSFLSSLHGLRICNSLFFLFWVVQESAGSPSFSSKLVYFLVCSKGKS